MELLEGHDALHILQADGPFSAEKTLEIGCAVTDALIDAHEHGVIHRDIKPDNIMITSEGKIKLADLGLAKKLGDEFSSTMVGTTIGTPNYMSPEQAMNSSEADVRSDIYSLGATLYHMLTGTLPFDGESIMSVMMKHANEPLEPPQNRKEGLPENICSVIIKMMEKDPNKRYQTCEEVATALNRIRYAPTESEKSKTIVIKSRKFKRPITKIEELKGKKETKEKNNSKTIPVLIAIVTVVLLVPLLLFIFKAEKPEIAGKTEKTINNLKKSTPLPEDTEVEVQTAKKTESVNIPISPNEIDLFPLLKIQKKFSDTTSIKAGVLEIKPRDSYFYTRLKGIYGNCVLTLEYKFAIPKVYAKIGVLKNPTQTTNISLASPNHKKLITGNIQLKNGTGPDYEYLDVHRSNIRNGNPVGEWNKLQIILEKSSITIIHNDTEVSSLKSEYSDGGLVILAEEKAHIFIRKLLLNPLK